MQAFSKILFCLTILFLPGIIGCHKGQKEASNPFIHQKHKPSEQIKQEYSKQEHWWHRKKNKQHVFFEKKD